MHSVKQLLHRQYMFTDDNWEYNDIAVFLKLCSFEIYQRKGLPNRQTVRSIEGRDKTVQSDRTSYGITEDAIG